MVIHSLTKILLYNIAVLVIEKKSINTINLALQISVAIPVTIYCALRYFCA